MERGEAEAKMLEFIKKLPDEIREALDFDVPAFDFSEIAHVVFAGMGGSAISGDLAKLHLSEVPIPMESVRDYTLPPYVSEKTLVFVSSYSGNTEEALAAYGDARERGAKLVAVTSDGKLAEMAERDGVPLVRIPGGLPPRTALGWLFVPLVKVFEVSGMVQGKLVELERVADYLTELRDEFSTPDSPPFELASRLYLRLPLIYTSRRLAPVGFRWKAQINENAKAFAHVAELPELDHNEITGIKNPPERVEEMWAVFLVDADDHPRIKLRVKHTQELIRDSVLGTEVLESKGETPIERAFYLVYFGDFVSFYLAKFYFEDPIAIPRIDELKKRLANEQ